MVEGAESQRTDWYGASTIYKKGKREDGNTEWLTNKNKEP